MPCCGLTARPAKTPSAATKATRGRGRAAGSLSTPPRHDFLASPALYIVQHPLGQPLKLALDTQAVLAVNPGGTRVRYRTNTDHGSSGSPCFDKDWNLVALHHSGSTRVTPTWNEGIPFPKILGLLEPRGKRDVDR